jgi:hypothetical protein
MITNDFTPRQTNMVEFYTNQYIQTSNQIQTLMDKQSDLVKLIRELNDYQYLLIARQSELLRSLNEINCIPQPLNQTFTPNNLPSANQEPLSETIRNIQPLSTPRTTSRNPPRFTDSLSSVPPRTTPVTSSTSSTFDNYLVYTFLPNETPRTTTRTTTRNSQTLNPTNLASTLLETFIDEFLNPVSTAPTEQQIQEATTSMTYREISNPVNTNCPISLNVFQQEDAVLQINRCRHNYTPSSLLEWFHSNNHCPLCRIDIREVVEHIE